MVRLTLSVDVDEAGTRLDRFIRRHYGGFNQGIIEKLLRSGAIRVDGSRAKSSMRVVTGQIVTLPQSITHAPKTPEKPPPDAELVATVRDAVLAKGDGWLALNKPAGLASQGGSKTMQHIDGVLALAFPDSDDRPRLVHRLDKDTSGVLLIATSLAAARKLTADFRTQRIAKTYLALVLGVPNPPSGVIDAPLAKAGKIEKMVVDREGGLEAQTQYVVLENCAKKVSLVALSPLTGRTHQLRVHLHSINCPILGDGKYGGGKYGGAFPNEAINRLCLHATHLTLASGEAITSPIPPDFAKILAFFGVDSQSAFDQVKGGVL